MAYSLPRKFASSFSLLAVLLLSFGVATESFASGPARTDPKLSIRLYPVRPLPSGAPYLPTSRHPLHADIDCGEQPCWAKVNGYVVSRNVATAAPWFYADGDEVTTFSLDPTKPAPADLDFDSYELGEIKSRWDEGFEERAAIFAEVHLLSSGKIVYLVETENFFLPCKYCG